MSVHKMSADKIFVYNVIGSEMTEDKMTVDKMTEDEMTIDKMIKDEMT
jgi:hypothetical protein